MEPILESSGETLQVAVIIGHHAFDVPNFWRLFQSIPGIEIYPQTLANYAADYGKAHGWYDVVLFYNYHQETPEAAGGAWSLRKREAIERLGERRQGIIILHHGLVAFPGWDCWSAMVGIADRRFRNFPEERMQVEVTQSSHPITRGLTGMELVDETYQMESAGPDSDILLETSHPNSMRTVAWARQHGQARVFCCQPGHDNHTYSSPDFRALLARALTWTAYRL